MKHKIVLLDETTGKKFTLGTESDVLTDDLIITLPGKNGTLALTEDLANIQEFLNGGELNASDSEKLGGIAANEYALANLSNITGLTLSPEAQANLKGDKGYTGSTGIQGIQGYTGSQGVVGYVGSKGDIGYTGSQGIPGQGLQITAIFDSLALLLAGTTTDGTFGIVAGTLPVTDVDYGKLYFRKNSTWTYITDMSIEGAAGVQGPQGVIGYTGSKGATGYTGSAGTNGTNGTQGYTGSKGVDGIDGSIGYTGSKGATGYNGSVGATGPQGATGATGPQGPQGVQGNTGATGAQGPQGVQGNTGATGAQGPIGYTGSTGAILTTGDIGSHVLASTDYVSGESYTYVGVNYGSNIAGSSLKPASAIGRDTGSLSSNTASITAAALSGTWKALSNHVKQTNNYNPQVNLVGLFVRIA